MQPAETDYERLIQPIEDRMIRSVWRILKDPDKADDAFQEAVSKICIRIAEIRRHPNPHALILRICMNAAYDVLRQGKRQHQSIDEVRLSSVVPPTPAPTPLDCILNTERRDEVIQAIHKLPHKQAEAILMRFVDDEPYTTIAHALQCCESTVRTHVERGLASLSKRLAHLL